MFHSDRINEINELMVPHWYQKYIDANPILTDFCTNVKGSQMLCQKNAMSVKAA